MNEQRKKDCADSIAINNCIGFSVLLFYGIHVCSANYHLIGFHFNNPSSRI